MIVVEDKLGITKYLEDKKIIVSAYKGRVDIDMSFDHLAKVIEFYKHNEVRAAIIDLRELYGSFAVVMDYLGKAFYPIAIKSGLKAQAYILKNDLIIENLASKLQMLTKKFNVEARTFYTKEEANQWINSII